MTVKLPDVTLVAIDSVAHDLTRIAIEDTLRQIEPSECLIFTDRAEAFAISGSVIHVVLAKLNSYDAVARALWHEVPLHVRTSHFLTVQHDGWVLDGTAWRPEWLDCDYIGARWGWHGDGLEVGNGGFSLRSTAMMRWLALRPDRFPPAHPEDDTLCRRYRGALEREGFAWADAAEARRFSFERSEPRPTFGYHGLFNWPRILDPVALRRRIELANDYVRGKSEWGEMMAAARGVLAA